ncbi:MAG: peptidoglycan DD-metalloendopeptidase family protein [Clostridia bacterium]|nr:peptidoglycan DD-metalloendopeptidase family protein [Clostridia bacterium]MBR4055013.1 peptidoglycan DD-metalloendopeptidase family protein [Clostridia bacterium]
MWFLKPKKLLCLALCLCLSCAVFLATVRSTPAEEVAGRTIADIDKDIKDCEALLSRLQSEQKELAAELENLQGESTTNAEKAELLAGQIVLLGSQIQLNESLLQSCDMKRSTAQAELILVENEYEYYCDLFAELMRFVYENGAVNDFELLFSSDSLSDYLERRDNFNSIMECVSDLRASTEQSLMKLEDLNREYDIACEKYELYLTTLEEEQAALEVAMAEFDLLNEELNLNLETLSERFTSLGTTAAETAAKLEQLKKERLELYQQQIDDNNATFKPVDGGFIWPLDEYVSYRITSHYSTRTNPITGVGTEFHSGLDIACAKGSPILAAAGGVVTKSAWYGGYGNCVIIYHGQNNQGVGVTTLYGHASKLICEEGQTVKQGDIVALVGTTGRSTGNHLHFSVLLGGEYVDPDDYLPDGYYTKLPNKK